MARRGEFGAVLAGVCQSPSTPAGRPQPVVGTPGISSPGPGPVRPRRDEHTALNYLLLADVLRTSQIMWAQLVYQPVLVTPDLLLMRYGRRQRWIAHAHAVVAAVSAGRPAAEVAARMHFCYADLTGAALPACGCLIDVAA
jgi:hypothetical protein